MTAPSVELQQTLEKHGQQHLLHGWAGLSAEKQAEYGHQLAGFDFAFLTEMFAKRDTPAAVLPSRDELAPLPLTEPSSSCRDMGEGALRNGEVAVLVVAGGQGTRLGFDKPKGMYPVGPLSGATLFQIHAQKVLALSRRYDRPVPFLIMTSSATHAETVAYFESEQFFGLYQSQVHFFQQGAMPALDLNTGQLLLEAPGQVVLSPNGHGGTLTALADTGLLATLKSQGVKHIFYFQVDNALVKIADAEFVGLHTDMQSEASSKAVRKIDPAEKVGLLALLRGRCGILEYSDLTPEMANERAADGSLAFQAGNPAIHIFSVEFLERVTSGCQRLSYHVARKKVPYFDVATATVKEPAEPNALKFELFIFDALPLAERWLAMETARDDEFAPLKNASGNDSLSTVQELMVKRNRRWLQAAGVNVPDNAVVEISPLFALDAAELKAKASTIRISGPTLLS